MRSAFSLWGKIIQPMCKSRGHVKVFQEGAPKEKKDFIRFFIDKIDLDPVKKTALIYIRKFPATAAAGNHLLRLVAGAGIEQQMTQL